MAKDRHGAKPPAAGVRPPISARRGPLRRAIKRIGVDGPERTALQVQETSMAFFRLGAFVVAAHLLLVSFAVAQQAPTPAPAAPPAQPRVAVPGDPFGEEVMLTPKIMVLAKGAATWDTAFDSLVGSFKTVLSALQKQGIKPSGPPMTIYTSTDDTGFEYMAGFPVAQEPKGPLPPDVSIGKSPEGRALKYIHRGSYDAMDSTYEAITNNIEEKKLEARDLFAEQYVTDPLTTPEENLVIEIYVPVK
jgi:effector-binding domain-containing protein